MTHPDARNLFGAMLFASGGKKRHCGIWAVAACSPLLQERTSRGRKVPGNLFWAVVGEVAISYRDPKHLGCPFCRGCTETPLKSNILV